MHLVQTDPGDARSADGDLHEPAQRVRELHLPGVWHATFTSSGEATTIATHRARDVATFSRLSEYRNSMPRGASSGVDVAIE